MFPQQILTATDLHRVSTEERTVRVVLQVVQLLITYPNRKLPTPTLPEIIIPEMSEVQLELIKEVQIQE